MLYITICDDEPSQRSWLEELVNEWAGERKLETDICLCQSGEQLLFLWEERPRTDLLLLDIAMPGMDGMALAHKLREKGESVQIIFITGLSDHVLEGYDVEAVSYLIKPIGKTQLFSCLNRAAERCEKEEPALLLELPGGMARVQLKKICYIESFAHDTEIHCSNTREIIRCRTGIREMEERIEKETDSFFRIHRSYLVNLAYVSRITRKDVRMDGGENLPVARGRWEILNQSYLNYYRKRQR